MSVDHRATNLTTPLRPAEKNLERVSASDWFSRTLDQVFEELNVDPARGLSQAEATARLAKFGPNSLKAARERSALSIFVAQFQSIIVALLIAATVIAFAMNETIEGIAILVVVVINALIGFLTEWKAEHALSVLQKQAVAIAQVMRDGVEKEIPASDLVPGDLVVLAAGARVPADGRIIEDARLQIEEAAITGESVPVMKSSETIADPGAALGDRLNMAFLGTTITDGRGRMVVTATGANSEVGKIGLLIDEVAAHASPLEQQLAQLGRIVVAIVMALCAVIVAAGWFRGTTDFWHMLEIGISLAIAAVPEGLPAATTMTLALGMQRMAKMRALVRRLPAVETLGSVNVIGTDKTGTLTKNEMTVRVFLLDDRRIDVTGTGYVSEGIFQIGNDSVDPQSDDQLLLSLRIGLLCNDAKVTHDDSHHTVLGDPTEGALIIAAEKAGLVQSEVMNEFPRISEVPFDSVSKRMVTVHRTPQGKITAYFKGSPGVLIAASRSHVRSNEVIPMTAEDRHDWEERNRELASGAMRVLALAYREVPENSNEENLAQDLVFVGLVGMIDPLRDEAKAAIKTCREAGIRIVMITGDQQATAAEIARQLGIDLDLEGRPLNTVHGRDLADVDDEAWKRIVADAAVFARVSPEHKLRIVESLQRRGNIVAMTGDGVNDAPALKTADIGIAMGIKGTEVAKENADMVITDDNFVSIVRAVEQGRIIYANILRFINYLFSCNFSEVLTVFFALLIGWPLPLVALQILWLNLVTDVFPAFALALEPSAPDMMKRPPRDPHQSLLPVRFIVQIAWQGLLIAMVTLVAFAVGMHWHGTEDEDLRRASTMAFMTLALAQVVHVFDSRSEKRSAFTARLFTNGWLWGAVAVCLILQALAVYVPVLQRVLRTVPPTPAEWAVIALCAVAPLVVVEIVKLIRRMAV